MNNKKIFFRFTVFLCIFSLICFVLYKLAVQQDSKTTITRCYSVMGGIILEIKLYGIPKDVEFGAEAMYRSVSEVDKTCNIYNPDSEISKLNASAYEQPFKCSDLLWDVLIESKKYYELSEGAFDISAAPLMKLWGFYRKRKSLPSEKEIADAKQTVGLDKVIFNTEDKSIKFTVPGMRLDLGGIAKGFAVDRAAQTAQKLNLNTGLINISGNAYCLPNPFPGKETYVIGVKNPFKKYALCGRIKLLDQSVATSGDYERYVVIDGRHFAHIMDPRTGKPVENVLSVTVVTPSATAADALSTSIFINGAKFAEKIHDNTISTNALIIRKDEEGAPLLIRVGDCWQECALD